MTRIPISPGESVSLKTLRIVKWALERGGKFTAKEVQRQFRLSKSKAYLVTAEWRKVFGSEPPKRGRKPSKAELQQEQAELTASQVAPGDVHQTTQVPSRIDLASLIHRR